MVMYSMGPHPIVRRTPSNSPFLTIYIVANVPPDGRSDQESVGVEHAARNRMRSPFFVLLLVVVVGGCSHSRPQAGAPTAAQVDRSGHKQRSMAHCPSSVTGAITRAEPIPDGVV